MKTAISLPDGTFDRATRSARDLGVSRSQLVATALTHYLDELERTSLLADINRAVDLVSAAGDDSNSVAASAGRRRLDGADDEW